jgi:hypothetical protein
MAAALEEIRELLNLHDWQGCPAVAATFQQAAVVLTAADLVSSGRCSEKDSVDIAAIGLGISPDTARSRAKRWPRASRS